MPIDITKDVTVKSTYLRDCRFWPALTNTLRVSMVYTKNGRTKVIGMLRPTGWNMAHGFFLASEAHPEYPTDTSFFRVYKEGKCPNK